jgi:25S rRNA (uracil2634-N3)-methyltransferase
VSFFRAAMPLLAVPDPYDPESKAGQILATIFENPPYTLWNIKDLARHVGLRPMTSFAFNAELYPGYKHARTLGNIEGENGGAWKGEDRKARTYVFEAPTKSASSTSKKRKKVEQSSSEEDG